MTRLSPLVEASSRFMRMGSRLAIRRHQVTAHGIANVPATGPVVLAVRHYHHLLDGLGLLAHIRRPLHVLIALDWAPNRATRWFMEGLAGYCAWPVTLRREANPGSGPDPACTAPSAYRPEEVHGYQLRAHRQCLDLLRLDRAVAIFPEGYPVIDPHRPRPPRSELLAPFQSGFARLAVVAARRQNRPIPVLPVGIRADPHQHGNLAFVYGAPLVVTPACDIAELVAQTRQDVATLSIGQTDAHHP